MGIGFLEIAVIFVIAFVVLGPGKTVGMAREAGRMLGEVRRAMTDFSKTLEEEQREIERAANRPPDRRPEGDQPPEEGR